MRECKENIKKVLSRNHYNYFVRIKRGVYTAREEGMKTLKIKDYEDIVEFYRKEPELCLK